MLVVELIHEGSEEELKEMFSYFVSFSSFRTLDNLRIFS